MSRELQNNSEVDINIPDFIDLSALKLELTNLYEERNEVTPKIKAGTVAQTYYNHMRDTYGENYCGEREGRAEEAIPIIKRAAMLRTIMMFSRQEVRARYMDITVSITPVHWDDIRLAMNQALGDEK